MKQLIIREFNLSFTCKKFYDIFALRKIDVVKFFIILTYNESDNSLIENFFCFITLLFILSKI